MADNALAAMLIAQQQQQRRYDPADRSRAYAAKLMEMGSSAEPVQSAPEGIARALTGALGGFFAGQTERAAEEKQRKSNAGLLDYAGVPAEQRAAMLDLDPQTTAAIAIQLIGKKQELEALRASADANPRIGGGPAPPVSGGGPLSVPLPPPNAAAAGQSSDAQNAVQFLTNDPDLKLQPHQAAGLVGNLFRESNMNPNAVAPRDGRDGSNSVGIGQWNAGRAQALQQFATSNNLDPTSQNTQLAFLKSELQGPEAASLGALRGAGTVNDAARIGVNFFRPLDTQGAIDKSTNYANAIYGAPTPEQMAANAPTAPGGSPIDPNAQPPAFVQTGAPQAPAAPPVTVQAQSGQPTIPPTTLPQISPEALDLQRQADAARATGTAEGLKKSIELSNEAQKVQRAHATKLQETVDTRTYAQQTEAQKTAQANAEHDRRKAAEDASKPLTESQAKEAGYYNRMRNATGTIEQFEAGGKPPSLGSNIGKNIPLVGAMTQKPDNQAYNAAKLDWISSQLRQETGANMPANEVAEMERRYFPQPGEGPDIIKQKAQARKVAEDAMKTGAGPNFKHVPEPIQPLPSKRQPPAEAISDLRANPGSAAQFDEVFGPGAAARALGR